jgi:hypothetical protein
MGRAQLDAVDAGGKQAFALRDDVVGVATKGKFVE